MDAEEEVGEFDEFAESSEKPVDFGKINPIARAGMLKAMREQKATWQTDGLGIRGAASIVSNTAANLVWPSSNVTRRANPEMDQGGAEVGAEVPTE
jgi:hypothetical protein